ncbi:MAG: formylglycine-generating enzyme family protein [Chitinivibrionia bacterium]|nr:formylglycine-generating enzyme family protein [Chitinivibrionia bacterium]
MKQTKKTNIFGKTILLAFCALMFISCDFFSTVVYINSDDTIEYIFVEAGTFIMGSPETEEGRSKDEVQNTVKISRGFWISKYPITNRQFGRRVSGQEDFPATGVNWQEAVDFAQSKGGRLPTEAEWEFAARGGNERGGNNGGTDFIFSGSNNLDEVGWYNGNSSGGKQRVGLKKPNELGIYDMSGNVFEWVFDWWNGPYTVSDTVVVDPQGAEIGRGRITKGGGFNTPARSARVADRPYAPPHQRSSNTGFRIVIDVR